MEMEDWVLRVKKGGKKIFLSEYGNRIFVLFFIADI